MTCLQQLHSGLLPHLQLIRGTFVPQIVQASAKLVVLMDVADS